MGELVRMPTEHDPLLSKRRLAAYFGCSPRTIQRWMQEGLPSQMIDGKRRFRLSEATAWAETRRAGQAHRRESVST